MLWDSSAINGYDLQASNGALGHVEDFIFEDVEWSVHSLVVNTEHWPLSHKVSIPLAVLGQPSPELHSFPVTLTMEQVSKSPLVSNLTIAGGDTHLHFASSLIGYAVHATDGEIGHVENFLVDEVDRTIRFITVHTSQWLPGTKVLISPNSVKDIRDYRRELILNIDSEKVQNAPAYDPATTVDGSFEETFNSYYGIRFGKK